MLTASMHFSGPLPWVRSLRRSTTLSSEKLIVVAPGLRHRRDAVAIGGKRAPRFDLAGTGLSDFRVVAMLCLITGNRELVVNSRQF
jgi:hypothetical protein